MKRSLLARLRSNGALYILGALILLLGIPLYQILVLGSTGFSAALDTTGGGRYTTYLSWISSHELQFLLYRLLLLLAFGLLFTLPFSLYRIIVAQELMAQQEREAEEGETEQTADKEADDDGMPEYAWRGKGFAIIAVWLGFAGICIYLLGTLASAIYLAFIANPQATDNVASVAHFFTICTNTIGIGALGLGILFFGGMIARTGNNLWPNIWVAFGYASLFMGALLSISAVAVASASGEGQSNLTTIATLLFALWTCWLGIMLLRLKAEA